MKEWLHRFRKIGAIPGVGAPGCNTSASYSYSVSLSPIRGFQTGERVRFDPARCARRGVGAPRLHPIPGVGAPGYNNSSHSTQNTRSRWARPSVFRGYILIVLALLAFGSGSVPSCLSASPEANSGASWTVDPAFKNDVFTFARVRYESVWGWGRSGGNWHTDTPDADLNLSFRLQQMTSLKVNPQPAVVDLTQKNLGDYPFIYIVEPGRLVFHDDEVTALRKYLERGGFLMLDDFWGENEWANIEHELKRVFPDREIVDLPLEHPIFHCVFDLKEKPQVPGIRVAERVRGTGITWERDDAKEVHYRAIFDAKGRMMVIICQNTDNGDGWEEEGSAKWYFDEFSEKKAYPLTINIIFYAMTH